MAECKLSCAISCDHKHNDGDGGSGDGGCVYECVALLANRFVAIAVRIIISCTEHKMLHLFLLNVFTLSKLHELAAFRSKRQLNVVHFRSQEIAS